MMTLDEAIKHAEEVAKEKGYEVQDCLEVHDMESAMECGKCGEEHEQLAEWLKELKQLRQQASWIPIVYREPTQEEKDEYFARNGEELCYMVESEMPLDGQEVLVSSGGYVSEDVFYEDYYSFENHETVDVDAWMPKPKAYKVVKKCCSDCKHHTDGEIHGVTPCGSCGIDKKNFEKDKRKEEHI